MSGFYSFSPCAYKSGDYHRSIETDRNGRLTVNYRDARLILMTLDFQPDRIGRFAVPLDKLEEKAPRWLDTTPNHPNEFSGVIFAIRELVRLSTLGKQAGATHIVGETPC